RQHPSASAADAAVAPEPVMSVETAPPPAPPAPPKKPSQLSVTAQPCPSLGCELVFDFSSAVAPAAKPAVIFSPRLKGKFRWDAPTRLAFVPNPPLEEEQVVTATIGPMSALDRELLPLPQTQLQIPVDELVLANKVVSWPVVKGKPRL